MSLPDDALFYQGTGYYCTVQQQRTLDSHVQWQMYNILERLMLNSNADGAALYQTITNLCMLSAICRSKMTLYFTKERTTIVMSSCRGIQAHMYNGRCYVFERLKLLLCDGAFQNTCKSQPPQGCVSGCCNGILQSTYFLLLVIYITWHILRRGEEGQGIELHQPVSLPQLLN